MLKSLLDRTAYSKYSADKTLPATPAQTQSDHSKVNTRETFSGSNSLTYSGGITEWQATI